MSEVTLNTLIISAFGCILSFILFLFQRRLERWETKTAQQYKATEIMNMKVEAIFYSLVASSSGFDAKKFKEVYDVKMSTLMDEFRMIHDTTINGGKR